MECWSRRFAAVPMYLILTGLPWTGSAYGVVLHVDIHAQGESTGLDWNDAFNDLPSALSIAVAGDEIWVAEGTYTPGASGQTTASLELKNGVALYGGFTGDEESRDARDPETHATILSGDLGQDDVYGPGTWYQGWTINTPNSVHVITGLDLDGTAVLDGFTIQAGYSGPGGGMHLQNADPTIRRCLFRRNLAGFTHGGGIFMMDSSPAITDCAFVENYVHLGSGGGVAIHGASGPVFTGCTFSTNRVITGAGGGEGQGAGIHSASTLPVTVDRCVFTQNVATAFYACCAIEIARGGGISSFADGLIVRDSVFRNNTAHAGAGIFTWGDTTIINTAFYNNTVYEYPLSQVASDGGYGAGVASLSFQPAATTMINCLVANNRGSEGVGFWSGASHSSIVRNGVVWGNVATGQEVSPRNAQFKGSAGIRYSCVQDLLTPEQGEDPPDPLNYPGCIVVDPTFVNAGADDFHLGPDSPCIDGGQNSAVPPGMVHDLDGHLRFLDDPATVDTGSGTRPVVDMGPYEFVPEMPADLDRDGDVDREDVVVFADCASGPAVELAAHCDLVDLDADGDGDQADFAILQRCHTGVDIPAKPDCLE